MRRILPGFSILLAGMFGAVALAAASPVEVRRIDADGGALRFEVAFDAPDWREVPAADGGRLRYPVWVGLPGFGEPGAPELPETIVRVAVPPGGPASLDFRFETRASAAGVRFPIAAVPSPPPGDRGPLPPVDAVRDLASVPARPAARIVSDGIERGIRIVNVAVAPVRWDPATGRAEWASRVDVAVRVDGARAPDPAPALRASGVAFDRLARTLLNPEDAVRWRAAVPADEPGRSEVGVPERWFDDAEGWVKIHIRANGIYEITRSDLAALGVPVATLDPRKLRLFAGPLLAQTGWDSIPIPSGYSVTPYWRSVTAKNGLIEGFDEGPTAWNGNDGYAGMREVAVWIPGEDDGVFDTSDRVVFYALGPDNFPDRFGAGAFEYVVNRYTDETVYWLGWGTTLPGDPVRMQELDTAPAAGERVTSGPARLHVEGNTWYDPSMYRAGYRWEEWFWERMDNSRAAGVTKRVTLPARVPGTPLDTRIRFWGANLPGGEGDLYKHHLRVELARAGDTASTLIGTPVWSGFEPVETALSADARFNDATDLDFTFVVPDLQPADPIATRYDLIHLCWIDLGYRRDFLGETALPRELRVDSAEGSVVRLAAGAEPLLLDVTDFRRPVRLTGLTAAGTAGQYDVTIPGGGIRMVAAARPATLGRPVRLEVDRRPATWLRDVSEPADYVIVSYDDFTSEADVLAAWRRDHLDGITDERPARVRVVRISDVYDEFSGGMVDPAAIRYFLEYAFRYWSDSADDRLTYALFLGDHTYDMRDYLGSGEKSLVPSWEDNRDGFGNIGFGNVQYVTDEPLARFDGLFDPYTDLYLGRITATTAQEAHDVIVGKVIRSEQSPDRGPWRSRAILVADDVCQGRKRDALGFNHTRQTEDVDAAIPGVFDREKIYLVDYGVECNVDGKPDAKRDLLAAWNDGAWLVNYIGHGADIVLADEHVLDQVDVPLLANAGRFPIVSTFSCSVGKFSKPLSRGLGEDLLMTPGGGGLVCIAATHLTNSNANAPLNIAFLQKLFAAGPAKPVPIGAALMEAKRERQGESQKYVCLGDPACRVSVPDFAAALGGVVELKAGTLADGGVRVPDGAGRSGSVDALAQGAREARVVSYGTSYLGTYLRTGATLFRGTSVLAADSAGVAFVVPTVLRPGNDGRLRTYVLGDGWDALGGVSDLPVVGATTPPDDTTGPALDFEIPSTQVAPGQVLTLSASDPAGINLTRQFEFQGIIVRVRDASGLDLVRLDVTDRFQYRTGSHTDGNATFAVPNLDAGTYDLVLSAYDNFGNRGGLTRRVELLPSGSGLIFRQVAAWPNPIAESTRILFTLDRAAAVTARIFSVSGRLVRELTLDAAAGASTLPWDGRDGRGDPVANGVYLLRLTASETGGKGTGSHLERLVVFR